MMINNYPYDCTLDNGEVFTPTMIDYENQQVWRQKGQASENGEWIDFSEVRFTKRPSFLSLTLNGHKRNDN